MRVVRACVFFHWIFFFCYFFHQYTTQRIAIIISGMYARLLRLFTQIHTAMEIEETEHDSFDFYGIVLSKAPEMNTTGRGRWGDREVYIYAHTHSHQVRWTEQNYSNDAHIGSYVWRNVPVSFEPSLSFAAVCTWLSLKWQSSKTAQIDGIWKKKVLHSPIPIHDVISNSNGSTSVGGHHYCFSSLSLSLSHFLCW